MITNRDLEIIPISAAAEIVDPGRIEAWERVARRLHTDSLERVLRVVLRLLARASIADPQTRSGLLAEADELDAAVRAARDLFFPPSTAPPSTAPARPSVAAPRPVLDDRPGHAGATQAREDGVEVALLDACGVIVWVNDAWNDFCLDNGGDPGRAGTGLSYLGLCDAQADTDAPSAELATAIRDALRGDLPAPARVLVPCSAPHRPRAFDVLVSSRRDDHGGLLGATVTLSEVSSPDRPRVGAGPRRAR